MPSYGSLAFCSRASMIDPTRTSAWLTGFHNQVAATQAAAPPESHLGLKLLIEQLESARSLPRQISRPHSARSLKVRIDGVGDQLLSGPCLLVVSDPKPVGVDDSLVTDDQISSGAEEGRIPLALRLSRCLGTWPSGCSSNHGDLMTPAIARLSIATPAGAPDER
jgi:hypothetical protein